MQCLKNTSVGGGLCCWLFQRDILLSLQSQENVPLTEFSCFSPPSQNELKITVLTWMTVDLHVANCYCFPSFLAIMELLHKDCCMPWHYSSRHRKSLKGCSVSNWLGQIWSVASKRLTYTVRAAKGEWKEIHLLSILFSDRDSSLHGHLHIIWHTGGGTLNYWISFLSKIRHLSNPLMLDSGFTKGQEALFA